MANKVNCRHSQLSSSLRNNKRKLVRKCDSRLKSHSFRYIRSGNVQESGASVFKQKCSKSMLQSYDISILTWYIHCERARQHIWTSSYRLRFFFIAHEVITSDSWQHIWCPIIQFCELGIFHLNLGFFLFIYLEQRDNLLHKNRCKNTIAWN